MTQRILYTQPDGPVAIVVPVADLAAGSEGAVPDGISFEVVDTTDVPSDRTFRNAWTHDTSPAPTKIVVDMVKAKVIAHDLRRAKRDEEMKPHDDIVAKNIPGQDAVAAEAARAILRTKYATIQTDIDATADEAALKQVLVDSGVL